MASKRPRSPSLIFVIILIVLFISAMVAVLASQNSKSADLRARAGNDLAAKCTALCSRFPSSVQSACISRCTQVGQGTMTCSQACSVVPPANESFCASTCRATIATNSGTPRDDNTKQAVCASACAFIKGTDFYAPCINRCGKVFTGAMTCSEACSVFPGANRQRCNDICRTKIVAN